MNLRLVLYKLRVWMFFFSLVFFLSYCTHSAVTESESEDLMENADYAKLNVAIRNKINAISDTGTISKNYLNYADTLKVLFGDKTFSKELLGYMLNKAQHPLNSIVEFAKKAHWHGLESEYYHANFLEFCHQRIQSHQWDEAKKIPYDSLAMLLLLSADASMGLYHDLNCGRVDPNYTGSLDKLPRRKCGNLKQLVASDTMLAAIKKAFPSFEPYNALQKEYSRLLTLKDTSTIEKIAVKKRIKPGDSISVNWCKILEKRMVLHGLFAVASTSTTKYYTPRLSKAITEYQFAHGMEPTGVLDKELAAVLNTDLKVMKLRLRASLERWRWLGPVSETTKIWANIAENKLYGFKEDTLKLEMRVCSGKNRDANYYKRLAESKKDADVVAPDNLETPLMKAKLTHFVANPTWHVPRNIMVKEILPQMQRDPGYLAKHNYKLLNLKNEELDPFEIDWKNVSKVKWKYKIEQQPGEDNSLGKVVIHFPNLYSIFMHDTPSKFAFNADFRHVSHGCVRMQNP
ncbi:MAG: L,D-transpeptidase family protein, partial [Bacteroidia bacterium]|nr:L,D-transpeptidase family protein [Bacteroidia bacterium]